MNQTRNLIVATSLALASLGPAAAHATTISTSSTGPGAPAALVASAAASGDHVARQRAPLSTGLLALGSVAQTKQAPAAEGSGQDDAKLAQREQAAPELRSFHGGRVYLYLGGGATLILVLLLILILL